MMYYKFHIYSSCLIILSQGSILKRTETDIHHISLDIGVPFGQYELTGGELVNKLLPSI